jgi:uncharacterized protein YbaR (Trm112 family)
LNYPIQPDAKEKNPALVSCHTYNRWIALEENAPILLPVKLRKT